MQGFASPAFVDILMVLGAKLGGGTVHVHDSNIVIDHKRGYRNRFQNCPVKRVNWIQFQTACLPTVHGRYHNGARHRGIPSVITWMREFCFPRVTEDTDVCDAEAVNSTGRAAAFSCSIAEGSGNANAEMLASSSEN